MKTRRAKSLHQRNQFGFSLIEVMISMAVMAVGLLGVLGVFGLAVAANQSSQEDLIARQVASEAMESIFTARNSSQLSFSQINNVGTGGIFASGPQSLLCAGPTYGIVGVSGDTSSCKTATGTTCPNGGVQCLNEPGFDGIVGTADDIILSLSNYTRTIAITPLTDTSGNVIQTLVQVTVTITYSAPNSPALKNYVLTEYISEYH
ncbi:MAG: prepilin-type N-terminal cleavage/methylation domain-containing protein [Candidatus Sulfotelmatobacter sp.]|jgi:prepilin-type N-terminal cleavage/methylation domain-containing protein